jgi:hypothetical protein
MYLAGVTARFFLGDPAGSSSEGFSAGASAAVTDAVLESTSSNNTARGPGLFLTGTSAFR